MPALEPVADHRILLQKMLNYAYGPDCPAILAERIQMIPGSDGDKFTIGAETLWAHRDLLNEFGLTVAGEMHLFASKQGWSSFDTDGRCQKIANAVRRDLGEEMDALPDPTDDPQPLTQYRDGAVNFKELPASEFAIPRVLPVVA